MKNSDLDFSEYKAIVDNAPLGVLSIDLNGAVKEINKVEEQILRIKTDKTIKGKNIFSYNRMK